MLLFDTEDMLLLLTSIKHNGNPRFVEDHSTFGSVGFLCSQAIEEGFIAQDKKQIELTEKGIEYIEQANKRLKKSGVDKEIAPLPKAHINKMPMDAIYLPEII